MTMDMKDVVIAAEKLYYKTYGHHVEIVECDSSKLGFGINMTNVPVNERKEVFKRFSNILNELCTVLLYSADRDNLLDAENMSFRIH